MTSSDDEHQQRGDEFRHDVPPVPPAPPAPVPMPSIGDYGADSNDPNEPSDSNDPKDDGGIAAPDLSGFTKSMLEDDAPHGTRRRMSAEHIARIKRKHRRRRILLVVCALLLALIAYAAYMGYSALKVKRGVEQAVQGASAVSSAIQSGNTQAAQSAIAQFSQGIDEAYRQTSQPAWAVPTFIPYYGTDVSVVRNVIEILNTISDQALPELSTSAANLNIDSISIKDSTISMPGLAESAEGLAHASTVLNDANVELNNLPTPHIAMLANALDQATAKFGSIANLVDVFSRIAQVAPNMLDLGNSSPRTYLVIAQNNAEVRPTGGLPASWGTLSVRGGAISISDFVPETQLPLLDRPILEETTEEKGLFGEKLVTTPHDVNFTPDYPRAAQLAQAMWKNAKQQDTDGVIMIDPVLLQDLLKITGGMTTSAGTRLDGTNTVQYLLHDTYYENLTPDEQDRVFSSVAHDAFQHIVSSANGKSSALLQAVMTSTSNGHLKIWSSHPDEQTHLSGSIIAGELETKPAEPTVGVYFSDGTQGKMDWYLDRMITTKKAKTLSSGAQNYSVHITMKNTLNESDVASLPRYVSGEGMSERSEDVQVGEIWTMVYVYAPADGRLVDWKLSDGKSFDTITTHKGLTVGAKRVVLKPGETFTFDVTVQASFRAVGERLAIRQTPLMRNETESSR